MKNIKLSMDKIIQRYEERAGERPTLDGISLEIMEGEFLAILGPSGCGKTTLLKAIAGLVPVESGVILIDGRSVEKLPPQGRNAAMIFQNYALFPHMTVRENISYGLKIRKESAGILAEKTDRILSLIKMEDFAERAVTDLSGGQQQRVAIGRAMVVEPAVLLFDEPLSNLDENLRVAMRSEIKKLVKEVNITSVYVTHDQNEAMAMADRIVVMKEGRIEQVSTPDGMYYRPKNEYVARFIGHRNLFEVHVEGGTFDFLGRRYACPEAMDDCGFGKVLIRSESIDMRFLKDATDKAVGGRIIQIERQLNIQKCQVEVEDCILEVILLNRRKTRLFSVGDQVALELDPGTFHFMPL